METNKYDYPELTDRGIEKFEDVMKEFKSQMLKACESTMSDLYCDVSLYIDHDTYFNMRSRIIQDIRGYGRNDKNLDSEMRDIREAIFKDHREDIIKDLNQDNLDEIARLKKHIEWLDECRRY